MGANHTPGPWAKYVNSPRDIVIRKMTSDGCEACEIARVSSGYDNARLIAAAPELLAALIAFRDGGPDGGQDFAEWHESYRPAILQARAAIEKATGSKP